MGRGQGFQCRGRHEKGTGLPVEVAVGRGKGFQYRGRHGKGTGLSI